MKPKITQTIKCIADDIKKETPAIKKTIDVTRLHDYNICFDVFKIPILKDAFIRKTVKFDLANIHEINDGE